MCSDRRAKTTTVADCGPSGMSLYGSTKAAINLLRSARGCRAAVSSLSITLRLDGTCAHSLLVAGFAGTDEFDSSAINPATATTIYTECSRAAHDAVPATESGRPAASRFDCCNTTAMSEAGQNSMAARHGVWRLVARAQLVCRCRRCDMFEPNRSQVQQTQRNQFQVPNRLTV